MLQNARYSRVRARKAERTPARSRQGGNAAIEFALIFVIAFVVFYATVTYSFTFLLKQGFTQAAQEGVRSVIKVDPASFASTAEYDDSVRTTAKAAADTALSWLPASALSKLSVVPTVSGSLVTVTITYLDYQTAGLLPVLTFPVIGPVPRVPTDLVGEAKLML